jgi:hypothetical protein
MKGGLARPPSQTALAILLMLVAAAVRLPFVLSAPAPTSDAADYLRLAVAVRNGLGFVSPSGEPTAFRPPLYPLFLAALGAEPRVALAVQLVLGALNCLLVVRLGMRLLGRGAAPWVAGALLAVDPVHAAACARLLSETLFESLFLVALLALWPDAGRRRWALGGVCAGLALLTRAAGLPAVALVAAWAWARHPARGRASSSFLACAALTTLPWLARNAIVMGAPVLTTQGGITLYSSYRPPEGKIFGTLVFDDEVAQAQRSGEVGADRRLRQAALELAAAHPLETLRLAVLKACFFWAPIDWEIVTPPGRISPVYLFALPLAAWAAWREPARFALPVVLFTGLTAFSAAVYGSPRLRLPYEFLLHLMAAAAVVRRPRHPLLWAWAGVCAALWLAGSLPKRALRAAAAALGLW